MSQHLERACRIQTIDLIQSDYFNDELTKPLLFCIDRHITDATWLCELSLATIAKEISQPISKVRRAVVACCESGFLHCERRKGHQTTFGIDWYAVCCACDWKQLHPIARAAVLGARA